MTGFGLEFSKALRCGVTRHGAVTCVKCHPSNQLEALCCSGQALLEVKISDWPVLNLLEGLSNPLFTLLSFFFWKGCPNYKQLLWSLFQTDTWNKYHGCVKRFDCCVGFSDCAQNADFMQLIQCLVLNYCQSNSKKNFKVRLLRFWFIIY